MPASGNAVGDGPFRPERSGLGSHESVGDGPPHAQDPGGDREDHPQAHEARRQSVSLHEFTRELRPGLDPAQRAELVEWLWRVAFADARLDKHEELMVRRVADLLAVPHAEFIRRKHLARAP